MRARFVGALIALMLLVQTAAAGVLRGRIEFPRSGRSKQAVEPNPKPDPRFKDIVVYLDKIPSAVERQLTSRWWFQAKPKPPRLLQSRQRFAPHVLAVAAGSQVVLQNADQVYHNAFSVSASKRFDLGRYAPGHLDTVLFDRAGVANLHCDVHPEELGFVVVCPNHAFARPDSLGRFELRKLAPGSYVLKVWHPRRRESKHQIEMPARGDLTVELKL